MTKKVVPNHREEIDALREQLLDAERRAARSHRAVLRLVAGSWILFFVALGSIATLRPHLFRGTQGSQGATGPRGEIGPRGDAGERGSVGAAGATGPTGPRGPTGPEGPPGATGAIGPAGPIGPPGPEGPHGATGAEGPRGTPGAVGATGPAGAPGRDGTDGADGVDGKTGPAGPTGARGEPGPPGRDFDASLFEVMRPLVGDLLDHAPAWREAIASIGDRESAPAYHGLELIVQRDLIPIGCDPTTGLWEFWHPKSGTRPARREDGSLTLHDDFGLIFVLLPGGDVVVGAQAEKRDRPRYDAAASSLEGPVHHVVLAPFFISKYEMTQAQWRRLTGEEPSQYRVGFLPTGREAVTLRHPVENVSYSEGRSTLLAHGLALPTEVQWEYACRGGTDTPFFYGQDGRLIGRYGNTADGFAKLNGGPASWSFDNTVHDGFTVHAPIGSFAPNGYGLYDVVGNLWEYCDDAMEPYSVSPRPGDGRRSGTVERMHRVIRGGSMSSHWSSARSAGRSERPIDQPGHNVGFRPARPLERR